MTFPIWGLVVFFFFLICQAVRKNRGRLPLHWASWIKGLAAVLSQFAHAVLLWCRRHTLISCYSWSKWIAWVIWRRALWPHCWSKSSRWFSSVLRSGGFPSPARFSCWCDVVLQANLMPEKKKKDSTSKTALNTKIQHYALINSTIQTILTSCSLPLVSIFLTHWRFSKKVWINLLTSKPEPSGYL